MAQEAPPVDLETLALSAAPPPLAVGLHHCSICQVLARLIDTKAAPPPRVRAWQILFIHESTLAPHHRLSSLFCGGAAKVAARLLQAVHGAVALHPRRARVLSISIVQRVCALRASVAREELFRRGVSLSRQCEFAAAAARFQVACKFGHGHAHAQLSWMLTFGREGVVKHALRSFELARRGVCLGCCHSKGALAHCLLHGQGCAEDAALALQLARESAAAGSSYGMFMLGKMHRNASAGLKHDLLAAAALYRAAAEQHLAEAQFGLGLMHQQGLMHEPGSPSARRHAEALHWYKLAAAQGQPSALHAIGTLCESGRGVEASTVEAVRWFVLASRAGDSSSQDALNRLRHLVGRDFILQPNAPG